MVVEAGGDVSVLLKFVKLPLRSNVLSTSIAESGFTDGGRDVSTAIGMFVWLEFKLFCIWAVSTLVGGAVSITSGDIGFMILSLLLGDAGGEFDVIVISLDDAIDFTFTTAWTGSFDTAVTALLVLALELAGAIMISMYGFNLSINWGLAPDTVKFLFFNSAFKSATFISSKFVKGFKIELLFTLVFCKTGLGVLFWFEFLEPILGALTVFTTVVFCICGCCPCRGCCIGAGCVWTWILGCGLTCGWGCPIGFVCVWIIVCPLDFLTTVAMPGLPWSRVCGTTVACMGDVSSGAPCMSAWDVTVVGLVVMGEVITTWLTVELWGCSVIWAVGGEVTVCSAGSAGTNVTGMLRFLDWNSSCHWRNSCCCWSKMWYGVSELGSPGDGTAPGAGWVLTMFGGPLYSWNLITFVLGWVFGLGFFILLFLLRLLCEPPFFEEKDRPWLLTGDELVTENDWVVIGDSLESAVDMLEELVTIELGTGVRCLNCKARGMSETLDTGGDPMSDTLESPSCHGEGALSLVLSSSNTKFVASSSSNVLLNDNDPSERNNRITCHLHCLEAAGSEKLHKYSPYNFLFKHVTDTCQLKSLKSVLLP